MKKFLGLLLLAALLLSACAPAATPQPPAPTEPPVAVTEAPATHRSAKANGCSHCSAN